MKGFESQTEHFVFDPGSNREPLEFTDLRGQLTWLDCIYGPHLWTATSLTTPPLSPLLDLHPHVMPLGIPQASDLDSLKYSYLILALIP